MNTCHILDKWSVYKVSRIFSCNKKTITWEIMISFSLQYVLLYYCIERCLSIKLSEVRVIYMFDTVCSLLLEDSKNCFDTS